MAKHPFMSASPYWRNVWYKKKTKIANSVHDGNVYVEVCRNRLLVCSPYNDEFVRVAYAFGRRLKLTNRWSFPLKHKDWIVSECKRIYGDNHIVVKGKL